MTDLVAPRLRVVVSLRPEGGSELALLPSAPSSLRARLLPVLTGGASALSNSSVNAALDDDPAASRAALGLGDAATHPASDFTTQAQNDGLYDPLGAGAAAQAAAEVAAANADNLTSGTVADARIPATIARDSEVTAAIAAEATARDAAIATAVAALTNGAPGALDTLKELADAINDDASFAASVTTALAGKQASAANLTALAGLVGAANKLGYFTGSGAMSLTDFSAFARTLLDDADGPTMLSTLNAEAAQQAASQVEAEAGTGTSIRSWTPLRIWQAIAAKLTLGTWISGATQKTTPVDADSIPLSDSASSGALRYFTIANLKTLLGAIYQPLLSLAANTFYARSSSGAAANKTITDQALALLDDPDAPTMRATLGVAAVDIQVFTASGTWTKPAGVTHVKVLLIGAGGGGGSGRKGAAGSVRCGGGGGAGGGRSEVSFRASDLNATESVVVGAGGAGGAAQATNSTNGSNGTQGGTTAFGVGTGSYCRATGGGGGGGGTNAAGTAGSASTGINNNGAAGAAASATGGAGAGSSSNYFAGGGGGSGGGITSGNAASAGGNAAGSSLVNNASSVTGGAVDSPGNNGTTYPAVFLGVGGSGSGSSTTTNGGAGGNGGSNGGGGGGGGAAVDSVGNSGAGGNGADGIVVVISW